MSPVSEVFIYLFFLWFFYFYYFFFVSLFFFNRAPRTRTSMSPVSQTLQSLIRLYLSFSDKNGNDIDVTSE